MSSLKYRYATMGSGKSAEIISIKENYDFQDMYGLVLIPSIDSTSNGRIKSRNGRSIKAKKILPKTNIFKLVQDELKKGREIHYVIVDEANFLTLQQVEELSDIVDFLDITVMAYGLLTNFKTKMFDASKRLIEIADDVESLTAFKICHCGKEAVINSRIVNGIMVSDGDEIVIDSKDGKEDDIKYIPLCRRCFKLNKWKKENKNKDK